MCVSGSALERGKMNKKSHTTQELRVRVKIPNELLRGTTMHTSQFRIAIVAQHTSRGTSFGILTSFHRRGAIHPDERYPRRRAICGIAPRASKLFPKVIPQLNRNGGQTKREFLRVPSAARIPRAFVALAVNERAGERARG